MRSPTPCSMVVVGVAVVVAVVVCVPGVSATAKHHKGQHHSKGHHHHHHLEGKEPRAARMRRQQDTKPTTPCTGTGANECTALANSECNKEEGVCQCLQTHPVLDVENSFCGKAAKLNESCTYSSQCEETSENSICTAKKTCDCKEGFEQSDLANLGLTCIESTKPTTEAYPPCKGTVPNECAAMTNSECNTEQGVCECPKSHPVPDLENSFCGKKLGLKEPCTYSSECEDYNSFCNPQKNICDCQPGFELNDLPEVGLNCLETNKSGGGDTVDPAMIGVLAGLALMFVIICVVLRLFSKARFRENRSIFNTPNPRLMNASLFKDSGRRGSAMSAVSATGSNHGPTSPAAAPKSPSPGRESKKAETTVAIETVD